MAENVVLEEEYDPDYVPTKEEIQEYADFLGMDTAKKEDRDLLWIAEEGLKAPLPSDWKPCKAEDADIYYFNFETGESRWEHPCDEYYKKLYKAEKIKQLEKQNMNHQHRKLLPSDDSNTVKNITENFDSLFQDEIEGILESDIVSSERSLSPLKAEKKRSKSKQSTPSKQPKPSKPSKSPKSSKAKASSSEAKEAGDIANKLQAELNRLGTKTDAASVPTFHLDLSRKKSRDKLDGEYFNEKQLYLESLESELQRFKEDTKREQMAKTEDTLRDEMKIFEGALRAKMEQKQEALQKKYQEDLSDLQRSLEIENKAKRQDIEKKHRQIVAAKNRERDTEIKEMDIAYNRSKNEVLRAQKEEIEGLRAKHAESVQDIQDAMNSDVDSLAEQRQSIQRQNESLQCFKLKTKALEEEHAAKLDGMRRAHEERLNEAQSEWTEQFEAARREKEQHLTEFLDMIENKKMDHLSERELADFEAKFAADLEERKESVKAAMHREHEQWKEQKKRYYAQCRGQETAKYEDDLKALTDELEQNMRGKRVDQEQEILTLDRMHDLKVAELREKLEREMEAMERENALSIERITEEQNRKCAALEEEMRATEQTKRDELRKEYKEKYEDLVHALQTQTQGLRQNMAPDQQSNEQQIAELKASNEALQSEVEELREELKGELIMFSAEKRNLIFQIKDLKQKLLNHQNEEVVLHREQRGDGRESDASSTSDEDCEDDVVEESVDEPVAEEEVAGNGRGGGSHPVFRRRGRDDQLQEMEDEMEEQSMYSTFEHSEFVALREMDLNESNELPSNASKWSEYLQREREVIDSLRSEMAARKKAMRQKQRRLEISKTQWKRDRDKLKMRSCANLADHKQFHSMKSALRKKKHGLDESVHEINEQILEVRESAQLLNKRESRLQTLEIEYMRTQGTAHRDEDHLARSSCAVHHDAAALERQQSAQSIPLMPHPPNRPSIQRTASLESHPTNVFDFQSVQKMGASNDSTKRVVLRSNSIGQQALGSVISKYVKHNKHTQRAIDHHKSWLRSFQSEIRNVSKSIHSEETAAAATTPSKMDRRRYLRRQHRARSKEPVASPQRREQQGAGEVVIRVKIEK